MTSNLGAKDIKKGVGLGFGRDDSDSEYERMEKMVREEVKKSFNPEFINRLDDLVVFRALERKDMGRIVDILVQELENRLGPRDIKIQVSDAVRDLIVEKGFDPQLGARPLRRAIQKLIEDPMAEEILRGKITDNSLLKVGRKGDQLTFTPSASATKGKKDEKDAPASVEVKE
jgi:ATP-dependent Clp protease ATP-binding subunit ClpC